MLEQLISVIVPVYNVEQYLEACVKSIREQSYKNLEIILVDDGSTDYSGGLCDRLALLDQRIRVIHKKNEGLASARNAGIDIASGQYLGFVDSDDWIEINMYRDLMVGINRNRCPIACCGRVLCYGEKYRKKVYTLDKLQVWESKEIIARLLTWDYIDSSACDKLFEKKLFDDIRFPEGRLHEDLFVMHKILDRAKKVVHIGMEKYYYRQRVGGLTRNAYSHKKMDLLDVVEEVDHDIMKKYPELKEQLYSFCLVNVNIVVYQFRQSKEKFPEDEIRMFNLLRKYGRNALKNKYLSKQEKLKYIFIVIHFTNVYILLKNLYLKIRS